MMVNGFKINNTGSESLQKQTEKQGKENGRMEQGFNGLNLIPKAIYYNEEFLIRLKISKNNFVE